MNTRRVLPALLALTITAGCGGGGDDNSAESTTSTDAVETTTSPRPDEATPTEPDAPAPAPEGVTLRSTRADVDAEARDVRLVRLDDTAMALQFELAATGDEALGTLDSQLSENDTSFR